MGGHSFKTIELVWIDSKINNKENQKYKDEIKKIMKVKFSCFEKVNEGIKYLKTIEFIPTYILCSGRLYPEFIIEFKNKINEFSICPKIIIFCFNKQLFLENNKNNLDLYINHKFYNSGGVQNKFEDVRDYLLKKESEKIEPFSFEIINIDEEQYLFEYISNENQLILPLFFSKYIKIPEEKKIQYFNKLMYKEYSHINEIKTIFAQLVEVENIPYEILYKYWLKALSLDTNFFRDINQELKSKNVEHYSVFIQGMYEGFKYNKFLPEISNEDYLYKFTSFNKDKIDNMNIILSNNNKENLPSILIYSKSFLIFNLINKKEELKKDNINNVLLLIRNVRENLKYCNGYASLAKYNINKRNQILIFPFVFFKVKKIIKKNEVYVIHLECLGEYQKLFDKKDQLLLPEEIPENSQASQHIFNFDIIDEKYIDIYNIITIKYKIDSLNEKCKLFGEKFVENNKDKCYIIYNKKKIEIKEEFLLEDLNIDSKEFEIKLGGLNKITDISHIFDGSKALISLPNISKINTDKITNMSSMFKFCLNLKLLSDISKWDTSNVTDMSYLFSSCSSLEKLPDISKWNISKVIDMSYMFFHCKSLNILPNISKWDIQNRTNLQNMFDGLKESIIIPQKFIKK